VSVGADVATRLGTRPGTYRLLPTSDDLVLLQRVAGPGETPAVGRVLLSGEIDHQGGLLDIIDFIHTNTWTGHLDIVSGAVRKALYCRRGDVQSAASNVPEDRLGAILFRFGLVSDAALERALGRAAGTPNRIGQLLVDDGVITAHDLYSSMRRQVEEIFYSVLALREGAFYFFGGENEGPPSQLLLSTKALLFEGVRRIDELSYFRQKLPSSDVVLVRREPAPLDKLKPVEERVLELVDGKRSIALLARHSQLGEFDATRVLFHLLQSGWVQPAAPRARLETNATAVGADTQTQIVLVFNEVYAKVHAAVAQNGKEAALHRGLESFFSSVAEFSPLFVGVRAEADGTMPVDQLLANLAMSPVADKLDYLHRGLNELLFFELFTAGEAVDRREEMELHQRLSQIMKDVAVQRTQLVQPGGPAANAAHVATPAVASPSPSDDPTLNTADGAAELEPEIEVVGQ
jgi:hypothetical protein